MMEGDVLRKSGVFLVVAIIVSLVYVPVAKGSYADDFLRALQDSLHKLGDPWIAGTTSVSHLSWEEKQKLCGCILSSPEELANTSGLDTHDMTEKLPKKAHPSTWDWRNIDGHDWMTSVKDQHSPRHCGSCWCFAATAVFEACKKIADQTPDIDLDLSEQFVMACCGDCGSCGGGQQSRTLKFFTITGTTDEACFPYQAKDLPCNQSCSDWEPRLAKALDWGFVDESGLIEKVMNGPCAIGVYIKEDIFYCKGGIYKPVMGKNMGAHSFCACGWNSSGAWLVKNSWGTGWNDGGYGYFGGGVVEGVWLTVEAPVRISLDKYEFVEPNDNIWDPGESIDIITTLKAKGSDYINVIGVLSTTDTKVNISNDIYPFCVIPEDSNSNNSESPFIATADASAIEHDVEFNLHVTADGDYSKDFPFVVAIGIARFDYADIVASNATLTVTDIASIGYEKPKDTNGSGFIYPAGGSNTLYFASMAFGNSPSYLVDNWYVSGSEDNDWKPTTSPNGRMKWVSPPIKGDTMSVCYYDDSGIAGAKNVVCQQDALAFGDNHPNHDDFVIMRFTYTNNGSLALTGLYSAIFADFDVSDNGTSDNADINESKYLAWMSDGSIYAGITLLDPLDKLANASSIKNATYVHPNNGMSDDDQYKFMNKTHHFGSQTNDDYGVMVSAGPFDLAPGGSQVVEFAIVGGKSKNEIEEHADAARIHGVIEDKDTKVVSESVILDITPNPVLTTVNITFSLPKASKTTIDVYDIAGKLVHRLVDGILQSGSHKITWDSKDKSGKKVPYGIYFMRLESEKSVCVEKVILLK